MTRCLILALCLLTRSAAAAGADEAWAGYRFAPDALAEIDLASDTAWTLSLDGGPARPIRVTAGGWNSDFQSPPIASDAVKDHAVYERKIDIPAAAAGKVVKVLFGGCNYGAEVFLDGRAVAEHHGPMTPFEADLTDLALPGRSHTLRVKAYHRFHYGKPPVVPVPFDFNQGVSGIYAGCTKFAYGLTGHVRLVLLPPVHVADVFVRPSVAAKTLSFDAWIANRSAQDRKVTLKAALAGWNGKTWPYPAIPDRQVDLLAGKTQKVTVEGLAWPLGPGSYWWPNTPFREDYRATLHWLNLSVAEPGQVVHERRQRFGFVQYAEGPSYYTVNGVRFTSLGDSISYGQAGEYDCWTQTPCFQPPAGQYKGCPQMWRRYQRIGFNSMRLSTSVPTRYMLETADEAGFMLVPEGGSWGNGTCRYHAEHFPRQLKELIVVCRNHPSVARYSMANESISEDASKPACLWRMQVDAALDVDPTRPYVFEVNPGCGGPPIQGLRGGHACRMLHYEKVAPAGQHIVGMGECCWATDGMGAFGLEAIRLRLNDYAHLAPWSWLNYWPNFLEGMSHARHPWKANNHPDRTDGVDGWGSSEVNLVQRGLHPFLLVDVALLAANPAVRGKSADGKIGWPYVLPRYGPGATVARRIEVFNGDLAGRVLELKWQARWDSPDGEPLAGGGIAPIEIEPGFHAARTVEFALPKTMDRRRKLCMVLESIKDGKTVYREDRIQFQVLAKDEPASSARFVGQDDKTQGNWRGKYGRTGHDLPAVATSLPKDLTVEWGQADTWVWAKQTEDARALATAGKGRTAACRYAGTLDFAVDLAGQQCRLTLYYVDWDRQRAKQTFTLWGEDGAVLDKREVGKLQGGCYLTWLVRGRVRITVDHQGGPNAVVSGLFVDPAE